MKRTNIVLVGMPGSGKTTLAKALAWTIQYPMIDIDDYMEEVLGISVGDILVSLGEEDFLEFEKNISLSLEPKGTIISCSGSVPLKPEAMEHLREIGYSILIDLPIDVIETRLKTMKVDRIVGMANGHMTIREVLKKRQAFYDNSFDFVFKSSGKGTKQEVFLEFFNFFMKLPFVKELNIGGSLDIMKDIYKHYQGIEKQVKGHSTPKNLSDLGCF